MGFRGRGGGGRGGGRGGFRGRGRGRGGSSFGRHKDTTTRMPMALTREMEDPSDGHVPEDDGHYSLVKKRRGKTRKELRAQKRADKKQRKQDYAARKSRKHEPEEEPAAAPGAGGAGAKRKRAAAESGSESDREPPPKKGAAAAKAKKAAGQGPQEVPNSRFMDLLREQNLLPSGGGALGSMDDDPDLRIMRTLAKKLGIKKSKKKEPKVLGDELGGLLRGITAADEGLDGPAGEDEEEGEEEGGDAGSEGSGGEIGSDLGLGDEDEDEEEEGEDMGSEEDGEGTGDDEAMGEDGAGGSEDDGEGEEEGDAEEGAGSSGEDGEGGESSGGEGGSGGEAAPRRGAASATAGGKYVPPALRGREGAVDERTERIRRHVRGLVNRVSEQTMESVAAEIAKLYGSYPRNMMNGALGEAVVGSCTDGKLVLSRQFLGLQAALVAALHSSVGHEVGAYFLERVARELEEALEAGAVVEGAGLGEGDETAEKRAANLLLLLVMLYNYQVVHSGVMYDVLRGLLARFCERAVDLLLLALRNCGVQLRHEDPGALKDAIVAMQGRAAGEAGKPLGKRLQFMLETVYELKNNKRRAGGALGDPDSLTSPVLRGVLKKLRKDTGKGDPRLNIPWKDLLNAEAAGRWWLVGSAWHGREGPNRDDSAAGPSGAREEENDILKLARAQRMNTGVRKSIFVAMMTSEDYMDAFEKVTKLGLKGEQAREAIRVLFDCCSREAAFNPFYALLAGRLCAFDHAHKFTLQLTYWDFLKRLKEADEGGAAGPAPRVCDNAARLLAYLVATFALSMSVLKIVELETCGPGVARFVRRVLLDILSCAATDAVDGAPAQPPADEAVVAPFERICNVKDLFPLRDGLLYFIDREVLRGEPAPSPDARRRTRAARKLLSSAAGFEM
eukprot:tig00020927_g15969.t1